MATVTGTNQEKRKEDTFDFKINFKRSVQSMHNSNDTTDRSLGRY